MFNNKKIKRLEELTERQSNYILELNKRINRLEQTIKDLKK
jgi:archaellum component FlaC